MRRTSDNFIMNCKGKQVFDNRSPKCGEEFSEELATVAAKVKKMVEASSKSKK